MEIDSWKKTTHNEQRTKEGGEDKKVEGNKGARGIGGSVKDRSNFLSQSPVTNAADRPHHLPSLITTLVFYLSRSSLGTRRPPMTNHREIYLAHSPRDVEKARHSTLVPTVYKYASCM
ncbi:UNVERIFIED_CONTAM: hypothetical protein Sradi_6378700 [Sesamum radiatum]|uniref:Uncharacterized protein n=1 Tax=Sesamum radiatum TaxID=300843 RepID=A0AAW2K2H0_SESRA